MKHWTFLTVFIIAAFLRLWALSTVPKSASLDEASIGFNAYSIVTTGKDEYGSYFPMLLRAYDDWRPALYMYLVAPFIAIFGLETYAVRLPSVLLSLTTVCFVFLIGNFIGKKYLKFSYLGLIACIVIALSPWHIYISRLGHEANLGITLFVLGIYYFLVKVIYKQESALLCSFLFFALSLHGYQSEKITTPILVLCGFVLFWKQIVKNTKILLASVCILLIISIPAVVTTFSLQGLTRLRATSAFGYDNPKIQKQQELYAQAKQQKDIPGMIFHNRYITNLEIFITNYFSHVKVGWLFWGNDREAHKVPGLGLLYIWELPFVLLGIYILIVSRLIPRSITLYIFFWSIISFVPAALTTQAPHAMRSFTAVPAIALVEALGFWYVVTNLKPQNLKVFAGIMLIALLWGLKLFWHGYFYRFATTQSDAFQFALKSAVAYAVQHQSEYEKVEFSHRGNLYQSYMFFLYYSKYDPRLYQIQGGTVSGGYNESHTFGKYAFGFIPTSEQDLKPGVLYFWDVGEVPPEAHILNRFTHADESIAIVAGRRK